MASQRQKWEKIILFFEWVLSQNMKSLTGNPLRELRDSKGWKKSHLSFSQADMTHSKCVPKVNNCYSRKRTWQHHCHTQFILYSSNWDDQLYLLTGLAQRQIKVLPLWQAAVLQFNHHWALTYIGRFGCYLPWWLCFREMVPRSYRKVLLNCKSDKVLFKV